MRLRLLALSLGALTGAALVPSARAADLAAVPRTIAKEPTYAGKPQYCLLTLGTEAKTRVWVVRDGDTVYVDRNGNGDLTEADEKVAGKSEVDDSEEFKTTSTEFVLGDLPKVGEQQPYTQLALRSFCIEPKTTGLKFEGGRFAVVTVHLGKGAAHDGSDQSAVPVFAEKAADAPVVQFDGPLALGVPPHPKGEPPTFFKGLEEEQDLTVQIGTMGLGAGSWAPLSYDLVGDDVHPQAEITFPAAKAGEKPIVVKFALDDRC